jgi:hypothetical protein
MAKQDINFTSDSLKRQIKDFNKRKQHGLVESAFKD